MPEHVISPDEISVEWLDELLRDRGYLGEARVQSIQRGDRFESRFAQFIPLVVSYAPSVPDTVPSHFLLKFNHDPLWGTFEAAFYRDIAPLGEDSPVPRCFAILSNPGTNRTLLVLEDLSPSHFTAQELFGQRPPTEEECKEVLSGLVGIHAQWWDHARIGQPDFMVLRPGNLRMTQAGTADMVQQNCTEFLRQELPQFADRFSERFPKAWRRICEDALRGWPTVFSDRIDKQITWGGYTEQDNPRR